MNHDQSMIKIPALTWRTGRGVCVGAVNVKLSDCVCVCVCCCTLVCGCVCVCVCVGADPYWPRPAPGGQCTPQSGRRSRRAAAHPPHSAACPASPQTASCLLEETHTRGHRERERERERECVFTFV